MRITLAAFILCAALASPAAADEVYRDGWWAVDAVEKPDAAFCFASAALERPNGAFGMIGFTPLGPAVLVTITMSDWQIGPAVLGSSIIAIDGKTWRGSTARGPNGDSVNIALPGASGEFWLAFAYGAQLVVQMPSDQVALSLKGSLRATIALAACLDTLPPSAPATFDPFAPIGAPS